ncbi:MAG: thioredoxin-dependent thiol peroxidase [Myxococcota bacterium]|nr:thioredoxin-dependent thiol peroxidase [Myxococcota bacterium]
MLNVGDSAPSFTLKDQNGTDVSLSDFKGKKVFVWFYPKASTPGCTVEGCTLRDSQSAFDAKDIVILGISMDSVRRQKNFATKQNFPYQLLADTEGTVVRAFGAWGPKKFMGKEYDGILRSSFLIDEQGNIEKVWDKVRTKTHATDVLGELS